MTILTVAGKADSRAIVYPLLYLLSKYGKVAVASDDGAYRRLYHGYENSGEVSGVSVFIHPYLDLSSLNNEINALCPDILVCVTNGYVPDFTTHLLVLTGYDRTFEAGNAFSKDDLAQGVNINLAESDKVTPPNNLPLENIREIVIAGKPIKSKGILSVSLKETLLMHTVKCEEYKQLFPTESRDFLDVLIKLVCPFIIPNAADVPKLFGFKK